MTRRTVLGGAAAAGILPIFPWSLTPASAAEPIEPLWWDNWPRCNNSNQIANVTSTNSDTMVAWLADEGRSQFFREDNDKRPAQVNTVAELKRRGWHFLPWLEGMGNTRGCIAAVHRLPDGTYEKAWFTGDPKLVAQPWTWDTDGPGVNAAANEVHWMGVHSWINREPWQGRAIAPPDFPTPTYPDGMPAVGYLTEGDVDPRRSRLWDALCGRSISGEMRVKYNYRPPAPGRPKNIIGLLPVETYTGEVLYYSDMQPAKDMAASWWIDCNLEAARYYIKMGASGFWVDNWNGFDFIFGGGNGVDAPHVITPLVGSFGLWSVHLFKKYLADRRVQVPGVMDFATFDVRTYLRGRFTERYPGQNADDTQAPGWDDPWWVDEPIWTAYKAFKADIIAERTKQLYDGIKSAAADLGVDPDTICVSANDCGRLSVTTDSHLTLDLANLEYTPYLHPVNQVVKEGLAPFGQTTAFYQLSRQYAQSQHAVAWYYLGGEYASLNQNDQLGELLGYEALANNSMLNNGAPVGLTPGTGPSHKIVNDVLARAKSVLGKRTPCADIAVLHSSQSEFRSLAPGGFLDTGQEPSLLGFYGWANALSRLNLPYRVLSDFRLGPEMLTGIGVLILPHVLALTDGQLDVIRAFVDAGGAIVVTGEQAGSRRGLQQSYSSRGVPALAQLAQGSQNSVFVAANLGETYYRTSARTDDDRGRMRAILNQLRGKRYTRGLIDTVNLGPEFRATLHAQGTATSPSALHVDLTNQNVTYDLGAGTVSLTDGVPGKIRIEIPRHLNISGFSSVHLFSADSDVVTPLTFRFHNGVASVEVPAIRAYGSIILQVA